MEQIIIDDDNDPAEAVVVEKTDKEGGDGESSVIIDLEDEQGSSAADKITKPTAPVRSEQCFVNMLHNNTIMSSIVNKCLNSYKSEGMSRIVLRTLKPAFENATDEFKGSLEFRVVLKSTLKLLGLDPEHKFSHIKLLCDTLKLRQKKKKVPFVTLPRDESTNSVNKRSFVDLSLNSPKKRRRKKQRPETSSSDGSDSESIHSSKNDVIVLESETEDDDLICVSDKFNENKTEQVPVDSNPNERNKRLSVPENEEKIDEAAIESDVEVVDVICPPKIIRPEKPGSKKGATEKKNLLAPVTTIEIDDLNETDKNNCGVSNRKDSVEHLGNDPLRSTLQRIEAEIKHCQKMIETWENVEVNNFSSSNSPYLIVDEWKCKAVALYKQLCKLTGQEPIKKRTVRLTVQEGHPAGPVRMLETLINSSLDSSGEPMFPDFIDVVLCVKRANFEDRLGWTIMQVMREARSLFTQCGEALRKRRCKREWRDLLGYAKQDFTLSDDPADKDPVLMAKLEQNKKLAIEKEKEILERFCKLENLPTRSPVVEMGDEAEQISVSYEPGPPRNPSDNFDITSGATEEISESSQDSIPMVPYKPIEIPNNLPPCIQTNPELQPIKIELDLVECTEEQKLEGDNAPFNEIRNNNEVNKPPCTDVPTNFKCIAVPNNIEVDFTLCIAVPTNIDVNNKPFLGVLTNIEGDDTPCIKVPTIIEVDDSPCKKVSPNIELDDTPCIKLPTNIEVDDTPRIQMPTNIEVDDTPRIQMPTNIEVDDTPCIKVPTNIEVDDTPRIQVPTNIKVDDTPRIQVPTNIEVDDTPRIQVPTNIEVDDTPRIQVPTNIKVDDTPRIQVPTNIEVDDTPRIQVPTNIEVYDTPRIQVLTNIEVDDTPCIKLPTNIEVDDTPRIQVPTNVKVDNTQRIEADNTPRTAVPKYIEVDTPSIRVPINVENNRTQCRSQIRIEDYLSPCSVVLNRMNFNPTTYSEVQTNTEVDNGACSKQTDIEVNNVCSELKTKIKADSGQGLQTCVKLEKSNSLSSDIDPTLRMQSMLESLGSNFETTVFDIEDPYLVIEISDSSSSDSE